MTALLVFLGGMVGAPTRYLLDRWVQRQRDGAFPMGTLAVNVVGSLLLGGVVGASGALPGWVSAAVGTGLCGGLTTFSTFGFETMRLLEDGSVAEAGANIAASLAIGVGAAALGWWLGATLV